MVNYIVGFLNINCTLYPTHFLFYCRSECLFFGAGEQATSSKLC